MISICIPIYNFDVTPLVEELLKQIDDLRNEAEIVLIDDASENQFRRINSQLKDECKYIQLEKNIGRSKIRNRFLNYVKHKHLLFLDCDSKINKSEFLKNYTSSIKNHPESVIYGGRIYPKKPANQNEKLAWKYGIKTESKPASIREKFPRKYFMTNNFIVPKKVLEKVKFDEHIIQYGYEDTLFGFELKRFNIPIVHINNAVLNGHLEENLIYLKKEEKAIQNLVYILSAGKNRKEIINEVKLVKTYYQLEKFEAIIRFSFWLMRYPIQWMVKNSIISLRLFNFYKLGYLAVQLRK